MGCDIHLFLEISVGAEYSPLSSGEFYIPRDYALFAALAGVRAEPGFRPLIEGRGFPGDASVAAFTGYYRPVLSFDEAKRLRMQGFVTPEEVAAEHLKNVDRVASDARKDIPVPRGWVSDPDYHHAGWLLLQEIDQCVTHAELKESALTPEFQVARNALRTLEEAYENSVTRIVFWFDN